MNRRSLVTFLCALWTALSANAADYEHDVRPLLVQKCGACHGPLEQESGLRLDVGRLIVQGGDSGAAVTPGRSAGSLLIERVTSADPADRMPPEGEGEPLDAEQVELLKRWIDAGARVPADEPIPPGPEDHWAFQLPHRVELATAASASGNVVDALIARSRENHGLVPVRTADKPTLLRRLYLDLIGLPPSVEELDAFLNDESDDAYEKVVDRLLSTPQYGERWGRHWMDVWRYSDWDGYKNQLRGSQRHIWRWRDWIVDSLNADKGYDRMVMEMLAGDELAADDHEIVRATGFLARNYHNSNRNIWLDAAVEHTSKAFLGLTINCARCHDHKYDPIGQREYYSFRAIFEPHKVRTERLPGQADLLKDGLSRVFDAEPEAATYVYLAGNEKHPDKEHPVDPAIPALFDSSLTIDPVALPPSAWIPGLDEFIEREEIAKATSALEKARVALSKAEGDLETTSDPQTTPDAQDGPRPPALPRNIPLAVQTARADVSAAESQLAALQSRWAADKAKNLQTSSESDSVARRAAELERKSKRRAAERTALQKELALEKATAADRKDAAQYQAAVKKARDELTAAREALRKTLAETSKNDSTYTSVATAYPQTSTGRRLALAQWIAARDNPLTARVAVNYIWMWHFGTPLVDNTFDFGMRTPRPVHADLLDWLAVELMENDWKMKRLHRLIVTSQTYRLASSGDSASTAGNSEIDADNRYLWRQNVRRLDAEVIRDSVLHVADHLDLTQGGPESDFTQGEQIPRRSLYFRHAYEKQMPMLVLFDTASPNECYRRSESIIPQQALALSNSKLTLESARRLASSLGTADSSSEEFIQQAFRRILSRTPTLKETETCLSFLETQAERLADPSKLTTFSAGGKTEVKPSDAPAARARENLVHVLMNHNDFVTVR